MGVFFINWITQLQGPTRNLLLRTLIFSAYLLAGAAIFKMIESKKGEEDKEKFHKIKNDLKTMYSINASVLDRFIHDVRIAEAEGYWDVDFDRWSYFGSLFFTATVLTTIGFGHMTPRTFGGQLFCMVYALFGIPITGLMLKSFGERLMDSIDMTLHALDRKLFKFKEEKPTALRTTIILFTIMIAMLLMLAGVAQHYEGWTFFEGLYFGFITLSTIGFGDFVPTTPHNGLSHAHVALFIIISFVYITVGLAVVSSVLVSISRIFESETKWDFIALREEDDEEEEGDDENQNLIKDLRIDK